MDGHDDLTLACIAIAPCQRTRDFAIVFIEFIAK